MTGTSPAAASTAAFGNIIRGLSIYDRFTVHAELVGATGGTLDVVLQREIETDLWSDWARYVVLADAGAAIQHVFESDGPDLNITVVGGGTLAAPTVVLATDTFVGGHPGDALRMVGIAGVGTSAGAAQTVNVVAWVGRD